VSTEQVLNLELVTPLLEDKILQDRLWCNYCKKYKLKTKFRTDRYRKTGYKALCKKCYQLRRHSYRYKVPMDQLRVIKKQKKCPVCKRKKNMRLDHNHTTGEYRGYICHGCNTSIGLMAENPKYLRRLAKYLEGAL